jgi:hypothetical protein
MTRAALTAGQLYRSMYSEAFEDLHRRHGARTSAVIDLDDPTGRLPTYCCRLPSMRTVPVEWAGPDTVSTLIYAFGAGDMNAGPVSACQGTVGDWASARWDGRIVGNFGGIGIRERPRSVIVEKLPDGRAGCRYGETEYATRLAWTPKCVVTANGISFATEANSSVELTPADARRMEGRVREAATHTAYTAFLPALPDTIGAVLRCASLTWPRWTGAAS